MKEIIELLRSNAKVKYGARVSVSRELLEEAADAIEKLTGPDTGYATGYQIGYACGKTDGKIELAKDTNVPTNIVVEVCGGMVQNVYANHENTDVEIADLDTQDDLDFRVASEKIEEAQKLGYTRVW